MKKEKLYYTRNIQLQIYIQFVVCVYKVYLYTYNMSKKLFLTEIKQQFWGLNYWEIYREISVGFDVYEHVYEQLCNGLHRGVRT